MNNKSQGSVLMAYSVKKIITHFAGERLLLKSANIWRSYGQEYSALFFSDLHTHTRLTAFFSETTRVSRYHKSKTNLDFTEARDSEWQWHQLGHMQVCISRQTDNHASTPPLCFTGRMPFLPPNQQRQSTESKNTEGTDSQCKVYA